MDLDSVRVNEYLSKEGHYQQSMSLVIYIILW